MEVWTRTADQLGWKEWPEPVQGLAWLSDHPVVEVLLVALNPDEELPELTAAVRLIRSTAGTSVRIIVASPHPSEEWVRPLQEIGIDHVWWVARPRPRRVPRHEMTARARGIEGSVCLALHTATEHGVTLSLCGRHRDRMVLAPHHLARWCLDGHETCPHWKYGPGWLGEGAK